MDFKYIVSVIVPFYNSAKTIGMCIQSVISQLITPECFELILVNDGSTDESVSLCEKFKNMYPENNIEIINIEHSGVAAARNCGINAASGKYMMFVDADDILFNNTVHLMTHFFDLHYDEVDTVFCHMVNMNNFGVPVGEKNVVVNNSEVVDLNQCPNLIVDSILPCVKNFGNENKFFNTDVVYGSEKLYFFDVTKNKMKAGYIKEAQYYKFNYDDSFIQQKRDDKKLSEDILKFAQTLFGTKPGVPVPEIYQHNVLKVFNDHYSDDSFWPHHYNAADYKDYENRVKSVMAKVTAKTIMTHVGFDKYIKSYWLRQKPNINFVQSYTPEHLEIFANNIMLESRKNVEWTLRRMRSEGNNIIIFGEFKLVAFDFLDLKTDLKFEAVYNDKESHIINVKPSFFSYYENSRMLTNNMWGFQLNIPADRVKSLTLFVYIKKVKYSCVFVNCNSTVFNNKNKFTVAPVGNILVTSMAGKSGLKFKILDKEELIAQREKITKNFEMDTNAINIRNKCNDFIGRKIWMYNDNFAMFDNGFYQFSHDVKINDGIERYYVVKDENAEVVVNSDEETKKHFVKYGSLEHILYCLNAQKIFTAFTSGLEWRAIQFNEMHKYWDIFNAEVILLSHGALNQYWPWSFSPIRMCIDKVVISTYYEYKAWTVNNFWEKDLIPVGMPRYDIIGKNEVQPKRKILMALSWRMYLAGKHEILLDAATPRIALDEKYTNSAYFKNLMDFLNSPELDKVLEANNVELDVNLHPQFNLIYRDHINLSSEHVHITDGHAELEEYMMIISDISSIMFDFAIFNRPIMYFIPDIVEFKAGCNHFREVIIPFEDGLGPCAYTVESAVSELKKIVENDFKMEEKYQYKLRDFHFPLDNCSQKLYEYCKHEGETSEEVVGNTPNTILEYLKNLKKLNNKNDMSFLKCVYDYIEQPYNKILLSCIDRNETDVNRYFSHIRSNNRYVVFMAVADTAHQYWKKFNDATGYNFKSNVRWRQSFIAVCCGNDIYEKAESTALWRNLELDNGVKVNLSSKHYDAYEWPKAYALIVINGVEYSMSKRGINVVIYDKLSKVVCDSFNVDLYADVDISINRTAWDG